MFDMARKRGIDDVGLMPPSFTIYKISGAGIKEKEVVRAESGFTTGKN
jgi:hypothetical protein